MFCGTSYTSFHCWTLLLRQFLADLLGHMWPLLKSFSWDVSFINSAIFMVSLVRVGEVTRVCGFLSTIPSLYQLTRMGALHSFQHSNNYLLRFINNYRAFKKSCNNPINYERVLILWSFICFISLNLHKSPTN